MTIQTLIGLALSPTRPAIYRLYDHHPLRTGIVADSSRELLDAAYAHLGFAEGDLLAAAGHPANNNAKDWVEKGDWLALADRVGAERVFFVDNYPVIVFAEQTSPDQSEWLQWFNSVWCMARPQLLFLARDGELVVFNLTKPPARKGEQRDGHERLLKTVQVAAEVQEKLADYRREKVESGLLFADKRFGSDDRADRALIRDLGKVRRELINDGLSPGYAHALIGRSIFIRYLEDRDVLVEKYFRQVANKGDKVAWNAVLDKDADVDAAAGNGHSIFYPRVLGNKAFTYALFQKLSQDFNGDMFPVDAEEQRSVEIKHLRRLRRFLLGDQNESLFFFAYRFDIIPIELISSIYEKFYSADPEKQRDDGSYYTPAALVEFVMSQTLDEPLLKSNPKILDPACGSGIFLVEAFRRIVRFRLKQMAKQPSPDELRELLRTILRDQIRGMDINREAIRVAAFSLYLAMLHYLEPPDILQHKQLPCLTYASRTKSYSDKHFDILLVSDAFRVEENVPPGAIRERFASGCADIVVGNPPWGSPRTDVPEDLRSDGGIEWCEKRSLPVGDRERSQSFVHRSMDLLVPGGRAGLLVSTGILFKRHAITKSFRDQWLSHVTLKKIVNFAAVRKAFFQVEGNGDDEGKGAIAPFASVVFDKSPAPSDSRFVYWSAKETAFVKRVQAVILNRADFTFALQDDYQRDDTLWKIYWWGNHRDQALVYRLRTESTFESVLDPHDDNFRIGWLKAKKHQKMSGWLLKYKEFPTRFFERYGPLPTYSFKTPPKKVKRRCEKEMYQGPRLLIKRGVGSDEVSKGRIIARYQTEKFSFRHSIYCMTLPQLDETDAKVVLAILWSSLTRYYLFMTSGTWGMWHDEVLKETLKKIPIRFPSNKTQGKRIAKIVDELRDLPEAEEKGTLFDEGGLSADERLAKIRKLEAKVDEAVFDLFEFTKDERERVEELCTMGLDLFYRGMESYAIDRVIWPAEQARFGRMSDLIGKNEPLSRYLRTYLEVWNPHLADQKGRLFWRIIQAPGDSPLMAAIFQTESEGDAIANPSTSDDQAWHEAITRINANSRQSMGTKRVFIDGLVRVVTDTDMVIIKRNERRLWTPSAARDDAEATMLLAMQLGEVAWESEGRSV